MSSQATMRRSPPPTHENGEPLATDTGGLSVYRERVTALAERIRGTSDVSAIIGILNQALAETRRLRSSEEALAAAQRKVVAAERDIELMRNELETVKALLQQDPLTGTLNRRGIDEAFRQEASRCDRHGSSLCIALLDLDNFKALNDRLGHQAGDRALTHVARVVMRILRPTDRVGRFGGEEFLLLLPDTALSQSATVLARVKRELAAHPLREGDASIRITFSGGVAQRHPGESLDAIIARADSAMYQAKHAGKNRTALAR